MNSASSVSLSEKIWKICQTLRNGILLGMYPPGERLDVNNLVGQYGVRMRTWQIWRRRGYESTEIHLLQKG